MSAVLSIDTGTDAAAIRTGRELHLSLHGKIGPTVCHVEIRISPQSIDTTLKRSAGDGPGACLCDPGCQGARVRSASKIVREELARRIGAGVDHCKHGGRTSHTTGSIGDDHRV